MEGSDVVKVSTADKLHRYQFKTNSDLKRGNLMNLMWKLFTDGIFPVAKFQHTTVGRHHKVTLQQHAFPTKWRRQQFTTCCVTLRMSQSLYSFLYTLFDDVKPFPICKFSKYSYGHIYSLLVKIRQHSEQNSCILCNVHSLWTASETKISFLASFWPHITSLPYHLTLQYCLQGSCPTEFKAFSFMN